jgi:hypothetical protein
MNQPSSVREDPHSVPQVLTSDIHRPKDHPLSEQLSKERKQAEAAFAKEQSQPISMPDEEVAVSVAEENLARQKAARLARDADTAVAHKK